MKEADVPGNGASHPRPRKRSRSDAGADSPVDAQTLAPFAGLKEEADEAERWPMHLMIWLQPELRPKLPVTSGLRIERQYTVPIPDFVYFGVIPPCPRPGIEATGDLLPPNLPQRLPQSALVPLGWDPRVAFGEPLNSRRGND